MSKKPKPPSEWKDEDRRSWGYMTIDEFAVKFNMGLKEYLHANWKGIATDDLLHPEDLTSNLLSYAEAVFTVIGMFGAGNTNARD